MLYLYSSELMSQSISERFCGSSANGAIGVAKGFAVCLTEKPSRSLSWRKGSSLISGFVSCTRILTKAGEKTPTIHKTWIKHESQRDRYHKFPIGLCRNSQTLRDTYAITATVQAPRFLSITVSLRISIDKTDLEESWPFTYDGKRTARRLQCLGTKATALNMKRRAVRMLFKKHDNNQKLVTRRHIEKLLPGNVPHK